MKQKKIKKLLVLIGTACLSLNMFISPAATITTHAAESETLMPYADITEWRFKIENGKMYKDWRLDLCWRISRLKKYHLSKMGLLLSFMQ